MFLIASVQRCFGVVVGLLLALAVYFQAGGLSHLLAASWVANRNDGEQSAMPVAMPIPSLPERETSAVPILARNAFDSVTGPLTGEPSAEPIPVLDLSQPLTAPRCDGISAVIVTESSDPIWSVAALRGQGEEVATLMRVGDRLGDREVAFIGYNAVQASPAVWLTNATSLCQVLLFQHDESRLDGNANATPNDPVRARFIAPGSVRTGAPATTISSRIQKVTNTEYAVERSLVDEVINQQSLLMSQVRVVPEMKNGETLGIRLFGIRPDSLLTQLGLENGDRLDVINGFPLASPEQALQAYAQLRTADAFTLTVQRRGNTLNLDYRFR